MNKLQKRKPLRLRLPNLNDPRIIEKYSKLFTPEGYQQMRQAHNAWNKRARRIQRKRMTGQDLYGLYSKWTGELHFWVLKHLKRHIDVEFFPEPYWYFKLYSGHIESVIGTVGFGRPAGERSEAVPVPRPEDSPSQETLDEAFRRLCLVAARVLGVETGKAALPESNAPESKKHALPLKLSVKPFPPEFQAEMEATFAAAHASLKDAPKRDQPKNRKSDGKKRSGVLRVHGSRRSSKPRKRSASARKTG